MRHHSVRGLGAAGPRLATGGGPGGGRRGGCRVPARGNSPITHPSSRRSIHTTCPHPATFAYLTGVIEPAGLLPPPPGNAVPHQVQRGVSVCPENMNERGKSPAIHDVAR